MLSELCVVITHQALFIFNLRRQDLNVFLKDQNFGLKIQNELKSYLTQLLSLGESFVKIFDSFANVTALFLGVGLQFGDCAAQVDQFRFGVLKF